ncbi:hypothetical protein OQX63_17610 [Pedobacter sp. PF22-3]|uniref:hypothetical protein n=1 Tax=Pedobacter sp. PF22-3 TaxID=2994467 RepID=UPI002246E18B|nr:hypothetical protein [Pedobacter sp. PF22-3]MCX2495312.1 hypothetical protein [Pedobacter sp. PF22-3]
MKKIILIGLSLFTGNFLFAQNTFPTSGNVGIGTLNPTSWFGGPVLQIEGQRPVLRLAPSLSGGLGTILFKGAFSEGTNGSEDEFHFNYVSNPADPYLVLGAYKNGPKTVLTLKGAGNVGIGIDNPTQKLSVAGSILSNVGSNEGGSLWLENPNKTASNLAYRWAIYNMTGYYGNSLQFWSYNQDNSAMGPKFVISDNGNVIIGKTSQANSTYLLDVNGKARANEIVVNTTGADFVFEPDYKLPELAELEKFVKTNKQLPEIPTAKQMVENGVNLGELNIKLLQKVEELTLHLIEKEKQLNKQNLKITTLETKLDRQDKMLKEILKKIK